VYCHIYYVIDLTGDSVRYGVTVSSFSLYGILSIILRLHGTRYKSDQIF